MRATAETTAHPAGPEPIWRRHVEPVPTDAGIPDPRVDTCTRTTDWAPMQYEGTLADGRAWYLRYKYGYLTLGVGSTLDEAVAQEDGPTRVLTPAPPSVDRNTLPHSWVVLLLPEMLDELGVVR